MSLILGTYSATLPTLTDNVSDAVQIDNISSRVLHVPLRRRASPTRENANCLFGMSFGPNSLLAKLAVLSRLLQSFLQSTSYWVVRN